MSSPVDLGIATIEREGPELVVVRFKTGSVANPAAFRTSVDARRANFGDRPHFVLLLAPDDTDFSPSILSSDQYKGREADTFTLGLAFVCLSPTVRNIVELYFAHHPSPFEVQFFALEADGRKWIESMLAKRAG